MQTKQIVFTAPCVAELLDAPCLPPEANEVTVSLEYSAISSGTEKANFIGARNGIHVSEDEEAVFPRTVGYSAAGVVSEIGSDINVEEYPPIHSLLISHTNHLIVLSSYRVYADEQHPVTETAPMLLDVSADKEFIETEKYAISKAKLEKYLNKECKGQNWTIVRPVISFSKIRFDLVTYYGHDLLTKIKNGDTIPLPMNAKNLAAGLDWAGNSGKLIANLLFKEECFGEAYTVSSAQNLTWGEVAKIYTELMEAKIEWVSLEEYLKATNNFNYYALLYDRLFDRQIDNSKILKVTGLTKNDFLSVKEGLKIEINKIVQELNKL